MNPPVNSPAGRMRKHYHRHALTRVYGPGWEKDLGRERRSIVKDVMKRLRISTVLGGKVESRGGAKLPVADGAARIVTATLGAGCVATTIIRARGKRTLLIQTANPVLIMEGRSKLAALKTKLNAAGHHIEEIKLG